MLGKWSKQWKYMQNNIIYKSEMNSLKAMRGKNDLFAWEKMHLIKFW